MQAQRDEPPPRPHDATGVMAQVLRNIFQDAQSALSRSAFPKDESRPPQPGARM